jgi:hypothetical protein
MKRLTLSSFVATFAALSLIFSVSGCARHSTQTESHRVRSGQAQVRESEPVEIQTASTEGTDKATLSTQKKIETSSNASKDGYSSEDKGTFISGCRRTCQNGDNSKSSAIFCVHYCECSHAQLKAKVPYTDLQAYGGDKPNPSKAAIESIRQQCAKSANQSTRSASAQKG